jgi:hypothetical protein
LWKETDPQRKGCSKREQDYSLSRFPFHRTADKTHESLEGLTESMGGALLLKKRFHPRHTHPNTLNRLADSIHSLCIGQLSNGLVETMRYRTKADEDTKLDEAAKILAPTPLL